MAHPNAELVSRGYEAFGRGDMDTVMELLTDDIVWHIPGRNPLAGEYRGKDGVMTFFGKLMEETGGTFRLSVHDITASDRHAVAIIDFHAERNGKTIDSNSLHVWHLRDGRAEIFRGVSIDPYADDAFWED